MSREADWIALKEKIGRIVFACENWIDAYKNDIPGYAARKAKEAIAMIDDIEAVSQRLGAW